MPKQEAAPRKEQGLGPRGSNKDQFKNNPPLHTNHEEELVKQPSFDGSSSERHQKSPPKPEAWLRAPLTLHPHPFQSEQTTTQGLSSQTSSQPASVSSPIFKHQASELSRAFLPREGNGLPWITHNQRILKPFEFVLGSLSLSTG